MLREKIVSLISSSIKEQIKIDDYSAIYFKMRVADNFMEGGVTASANHAPNTDYMMKYMDRMEFFKTYNEALSTDEKFNHIEIHYDRDLNPNAVFTWDQAFYDADVEGNKKLKKKKAK
jgi:hypothetical protein